MWANIAKLINLTVTTDDVGDLVESETRSQVFCNELSVSQTEFYQAMATGLKPEIKIEINRFEYKSEKKVLYNGVKYDVIRTYAKNTEIIELTLGGGINFIETEQLFDVDGLQIFDSQNKGISVVM